MPENEQKITQAELMQIDAINNNEREQHKLVEQIDQIHKEIQKKTNHLNIIEFKENIPPQQESIAQLQQLEELLKGITKENTSEVELQKIQDFLLEFENHIHNAQIEIEQVKNAQSEEYEKSIIEIWQKTINELQKLLNTKEGKVYSLLQHFLRLDFSLADSEILKENKSLKTGVEISQNGIDETHAKIIYLLENVEFTKIFILLGMLEEFFEKYHSNHKIYVNVNESTIQQLNEQFLKIKNWFLSTKHKVIINDAIYKNIIGSNSQLAEIEIKKTQLPTILTNKQKIKEGIHFNIILTEVLQILLQSSISLSNIIQYLDKTIEENNKKAILTIREIQLKDINVYNQETLYTKLMEAVAFLLNVDLYDIQKEAEAFLENATDSQRTKRQILFNQYSGQLSNIENFSSLITIFQAYFRTGTLKVDQILKNIEESDAHQKFATILNNYGHTQITKQERKNFENTAHITNEEKTAKAQELKELLLKAAEEENVAQQERDKAVNIVLTHQATEKPQSAEIEMIAKLFVRHRDFHEKLLKIKKEFKKLNRLRLNPESPNYSQYIQRTIYIFYNNY